MLSPSCNFRQRRWALCFPLPVTAGWWSSCCCLPKGDQERVGRTLFEGAASHVIWDKRHHCGCGACGDVFKLQQIPSHPSLPFWTPAWTRNKMERGCAFPKSCSWKRDGFLWSPVKEMLFALFLFFWNPLCLSHLLQDLTPQPDLMPAAFTVHKDKDQQMQITVMG